MTKKKFPDGYTKKEIIINITKHKKGLSEPNLREILRTTHDIIEPRGIKKHLEDLEKKQLIKRKKINTTNYWFVFEKTTPFDKPHYLSCVHYHKHSCPNQIPSCQKGKTTYAPCSVKDCHKFAISCNYFYRKHKWKFFCDIIGAIHIEDCTSCNFLHEAQI